MFVTRCGYMPVAKDQAPSFESFVLAPGMEVTRIWTCMLETLINEPMNDIMNSINEQMKKMMNE